MNCFLDLVRLRVFPNAKDISESMGAIHAVARYGGLHDGCTSLPPPAPAAPTVSSSPSVRWVGEELPPTSALDDAIMDTLKVQTGVLCISIGDGATPRTACLAAHLTPWHT